MNKTPRDKYAPWPAGRQYVIETKSGLVWDWFAAADSEIEARRLLRQTRGYSARAVTADGKMFKLDRADSFGKLVPVTGTWKA